MLTAPIKNKSMSKSFYSAAIFFTGVYLIVNFFLFIIFSFQFGDRLLFIHQLSKMHVLKEINEQEISRLDNKLSDLPSGKIHIKLDHPYVADLDVFGSHSLFCPEKIKNIHRRAENRS